MTNIVPFIQQVQGIDLLETKIRSLAEENPEKAYLLAHAIAKLADTLKKDYYEDFKRYFDNQ